MVPIYKDGNQNDVGTYRPIAILSPIAKIFEKLVAKQIKSFMDACNVLTKHQYGFRAKRTTIDAVAELTDEIRHALDSKGYVHCTFLDLKKAFDTVDHDILLNKLYHYGVRGIPHDLLKSYLSDRKQYVQLQNKKSSELAVTCGVPQGSVLGPLLFLLYINDLPDCTQSSTKMFADDTVVIYQGHNGTESICNSNLATVEMFLKGNRLTLNAKKTKVMHFTKGPKFRTTISGNEIESVTSMKYLGVFMDDKLSFEPHVSFVCGKISKYCGLIYRCRWILSIEQLLLLYNTYIKPIIHYGILVYGCANRTTLRKIQLLQNRILKTIFKRRKSDKVHDIYAAYNILNVEELHAYELLKYSVKERQTPGYLPTVPTRPRRAKVQRVDVPRTLTRVGEKCIRVRSRKLQNAFANIGINLDMFVGLTLHQTSTAVHHLRDNMIRGNEEICNLIFGTQP